MNTSSYFSWANSSTLFLLCCAAMGVVIFMILGFMKRAWKEALLEGFTKQDLKQMASTSALTAILPTISNIIFLIMLTPMMGRFFSWFRLSVLGSGTYEYMAADAATKAMGLTGLTDPGVTLSVYITVMWAMSLGIASGPICNVLFFKNYYQKLQVATQKKSGFGQYIGTCLMMTMMTVLLVPRALDFENQISMFTTLCTALIVVILNKMSENPKLGFLKDFAFPISMLTGVAFAILLGNTIYIGG